MAKIDSLMYEIYLDESNGSIREEDDDIPPEDTASEPVNTDPEKHPEVEEKEEKIELDSDKSKSKNSPAKDVKDSRDLKDAKEAKDLRESKDSKESKDTKDSKDSKSSIKDKKLHSITASSGNNNVWVSGFSSTTRAAALQALFKKHGKVLSAKIITNPRIPGSRAHGFITMETAEQAEKCIQYLNKTELDGKTITVSKNRPSESNFSRHSSSNSSSAKKDKSKEKDKSRNDENKEPDKEKSKDDISKKSDDKSTHDDDKKKKEKSGDKEKEKERDKEKDKEKVKDREKEKKKDEEKDKSKDSKSKGEKEKEKDKEKTKGKEKEKEKPKEKKDDKSKDGKKNDDDDKSDAKDDKLKKDRSSKSASRSRSRDVKRNPGNSPRKFMPRRPMRRMPPSFLQRRLGGPPRIQSTGGRPNPVLLRRIETERAQRRRERDRDIREAKRRRIELLRTQREVERKAQEERERLEREMEKLRVERERLEREKAELLRLEREKARLERERIEREREELRRKQFQLPHRIDDSPRNRPSSGISNKRTYDSRGDPRELDLHWDDRKRMSNRMDGPNPVNAAGRQSFNGTLGSRMPDFDARHSHTMSYESKGPSYRRIKMDNPSSSGSRNEYDIRRDSGGRHGGGSGGHDRDDRRNTSGPSSGSSYYRDSSRMTSSSRDRDRRGGVSGGGRDDWKTLHDRRDRYLDKGMTSMGASYSSSGSYPGGNSGDWTSGDRTGSSSNLSKLSYPAGPSVSESRSRGAGLSSSLMSGGASQLGSLYENSSNVPMAGIMSHTGMGSASGMNSDERPYMHSMRRF